MNFRDMSYKVWSDVSRHSMKKIRSVVSPEKEMMVWDFISDRLGDQVWGSASDLVQGEMHELP